MMSEYRMLDLSASMGLYAWIGEKIGEKIQEHRKMYRNK